MKDDCEYRRSKVSHLPSQEEKSHRDTTKMEKLTHKQSRTGYAQSSRTTDRPVPKRLVLSRSTARPPSYAAAASDTASSPSPSWSAYQFPTTSQSCRSFSTFSPPLPYLPPTPSPSLSPPPPPSLIQIERFPRISQPQSFFKLGMIIEAPLMEEDFMYGATLHRSNTATTAGATHSDRFSISTSHYGYIHTKLRKFVVVGLFAQHYVAVPMYTHNGDGLERKPDKNEFVSVRDARSITTATGGAAAEWQLPPDERLSDHRVLVAEMRPEALRLYEKTTVHFAYPVSRCYQLRVNHCGELERGSRIRLLALYQEYMLGGTVGFE